MDSVVRLGDQADESAIIRLLVQMHQENGLFPFSINRVRELVRMVLTLRKSRWLHRR